LQHWFQDLLAIFVPVITEFPSHHHAGLLRAVEEQNHIGWHQAILGFLGHSWHVAASREMYHPTDNNSSRGDSIITKILQCLHLTIKELWLSRNQSSHEHSDQVVLAIQSSETAKIRHFHAHPHLLPTGDQHYCERSVNAILCSSKSIRRRWLEHIRQARANKLRNGLL
jgi:hypothetical protein